MSSYQQVLFSSRKEHRSPSRTSVSLILISSAAPELMGGSTVIKAGTLDRDAAIIKTSIERSLRTFAWQVGGAAQAKMTI
ncbi:uncharacterized protein PAC_09234 [Phialocephala subalpina]|uniref:Uncharacterized protein n=1 Tax=Phialocephala subalpina TaxID=576137 RepID=A0A1L7X2T0_9HELO|nr:uncharacterized protein PAC_09234 [Phialocephala subalpina]